MEQNIKLTIAYDGAAYVGWQRQPPHQGMSVQQRIEDALTSLMGHKVIIHGAGRTDAGVHAMGQVANFTCDKPLPTEKLAWIINNLLPHDIRIKEAIMMPLDFHSRITTHKKRYRYLIEQKPRCSPFAANYSWHLEDALDIAAMHEGSKALLGTHDFRSFTLAKVSAKNFVRQIYSVDIYAPNQEDDFIFPWQKLSSPLVIDVMGNGFLYKMVRLIVARLVAVGQGRLPYQAIAAILNGDIWTKNTPAPAQGLFLDKIWYE